MVSDPEGLAPRTAGVAELVDAPVLGTDGASHGGSSPSARTIDEPAGWGQTQISVARAKGRGYGV